MEGTKKNYKIESAFAERELILTLSKLYDLQSTSFLLLNDSVCDYCAKKFLYKNSKSIIDDNSENLYHEECFEKMEIKKLNYD